MEFDYSYNGSSRVSDRADRTDMTFSPDVTREPTFFRGQLAKKLPFREAISALHDVVVSDMRWKPKDRTAYLEWLAKQEALDWAAIAQERGAVAREIKELQAEVQTLERRQSERWRDYYACRQRYFDYLYRKDRDAWFVLDPVITVHPDEIFFECFSQDESSYGRLGTSYEVFDEIGEFSCGTTNVDYSQRPVRRVPEDPQLQEHRARGRPLRLRGRRPQNEDIVQGGQDRPPRQLGAWLSYR